MRTLILIVALLVPVLVSADEWRPGVWMESVEEYEARQPPPACEERRLAVVGDSIMTGDFFLGYLHDLWVQYGDWYEWDEGFDTDADIQTQDYVRKGVGVSVIHEMLFEALTGDFDPTHVVIYGGINDCVKYGYSPEENAEYVIQALDSFVERARLYDVEPILVQHHPWKGSRHDKKGRGWECSAIVNQWIWGEQLMAGDEGAQIIWTGSLGSCGGMDEGWERQCDCKEYAFPKVSDEECEGRHILDHDLDAGDGLHLNRLGQAMLASSIHSYLVW